MTQSTDRERLARALYIIDDSERYAEMRAAAWDATCAATTEAHLEYYGRADRLIDLLGESPVLQGEPRAWLVETEHGGAWTVYSREAADARVRDMRLPEVTVTPLYAGPAQTISADAIAREVGSAILCVLANYSYAVANNGERFEMDTVDFDLRTAAADAVRSALSRISAWPAF